MTAGVRMPHIGRGSRHLLPGLMLRESKDRGAALAAPRSCSREGYRRRFVAGAGVGPAVSAPSSPQPDATRSASRAKEVAMSVLTVVSFLGYLHRSWRPGVTARTRLCNESLTAAPRRQGRLPVRLGKPVLKELRREGELRSLRAQSRESDCLAFPGATPDKGAEGEGRGQYPDVRPSPEPEGSRRQRPPAAKPRP